MITAIVSAIATNDLYRCLIMLRRAGIVQLSDTIGPETELVLIIFTTCLLEDMPDAVERAHQAHLAGIPVRLILPRPIDLLQWQDIARGTAKREELWFESLTRMPYARGRDQNGNPTGMDHNGIPISTWSDVDAAWTEVALEVRDTVADLNRSATK